MYTVIENQHRPDGIVNQVVTNRQTFASALSYYHDRISKMVMTDLYTMVTICLLDANCTQVKREVVQTQYVPPVETEQTEE